MTMINSNSASYPVAQPQPQQPPVSQPAFKGSDDDKLAEAIENANKTSSTAANAALITSCATLLPLSVLAYRTHNLSKVAEAFQKDAKPALEKLQSAAGKVEGLADSAKPIVEDVHGITSIARKGAENIGNVVEEVTKTIKSEEFKGLLTELKNKVAEVDMKGMNETMKAEISESIAKLSDAASGKIAEVNPEVIENAIAKISEIDTKGLSDSAIALLERLKNIKVTIG